MEICVIINKGGIMIYLDYSATTPVNKEVLESFDRVCEYWNSYLHHIGKLNDSNLFINDIAIMMILFKIAREENKHKHDNLVDICGYAAILDQLYKEIQP